MSKFESAELLVLIAACTSPSIGRTTQTLTAASSDVTAFGAIPDDGLDDRAAIQAAIDSGASEVYFPTGTYVVSRRPGRFAALTLDAPQSGITLRGESRDGVVLQSAPGTEDSIQLIYALGAHDVRIQSLTLDGNRANQAPSPNMQRHGLFCKQTPRCTVVDVTAKNFTGDGLYFYDGSDDALVFGSTSIGNQRNGLTLGGGTTGGVVRDSQFIGNGAEQFDSEGGTAINNVTIVGNTMDAMGASNDFVLTMTGHNVDNMSGGWVVANNVINGPALFVYAKNMLFVHNTITNPTTKPSLWVYRRCENIRIEDNEIHATGANGSSEGAMVYVVGTNVGQAASGVRVIGNKLSTDLPQYGVTAVCTRDIEIAHNEITGAGGSASGVYVRATRVDEPVRSAVIERNTISGFGMYGVRFGGNGDARILRAEINGNTFKGGMFALYLNSGYNEALDVTTSNNVTLDGLPMLTHPPAGQVLPWGDGSRWTTPPP